VPQAIPNPLAEFAHTSRQDPARLRPAPAPVLDAPLALRLWHLASLDAPTVAIVWSLGFAWVARVRVPQFSLVSLALTVWAFYVADRLLDARRALGANRLEGLRDRHYFHWRFRRILVPLGIAAALAAAWLFFPNIPAAMCERDAVVAAAALAYFRGVHLRREIAPQPSGAVARILARVPSWVLTKELLVGVLFAAGCALPAWNRAISRPGALILPVAFFAALAWLNCYAIDRWEAGSPWSEPMRITAAASFVGLAGAIAAVTVASNSPRVSGLLLAGAVSALLLGWLDRLRSRITPLALRAAADLVLLTPLVLVLR
jgi:hypothetical protein